MRSDMGKCVIERPRSGSSNPSAKARWYGKIFEDHEGRLDYDGFTRLPSSRRQEGYHPRIGSKSFSDVLGPIEGYLRACVGRPWDDVFSELCQKLGRGSWPLRHVLADHIRVVENTYRGVDGRVYFNGKRGSDVVDGSYDSEFYVHPETRVLSRHPHRSYCYHPRTERRDTDRLRTKDGRWLVKIKGLWFLGTYEYKPFVPATAARVGWMATDPEWPHFRVGREGTWLFTKEKSASRKELARAGFTR